ncbi:glycoside hydrolase family 88 protein [Hymenobacter convexus]|uniref:glycoside hydrolase family 88 protein n=1 Tax=Hymenobacter sp. CA1UV-4 TaxID=3063782 RepID=UPI002712932C|nr:glycoside hydrolase family 88 protein [Hymenobacter sp. CA1UV-4]MDO7851612.1 glycoside hydrolase family 88 protein [Hymenobacter sp. CA1UV-4]
MISKPIIAALGLLLHTASARAQAPFAKTLKLAETQATLLLQEVPKAQQHPAPPGKPPLVSPRTLSPAGELVLVPSRDWTSGFFPGYLWLLAEATGNTQWQAAARAYTAPIEAEKTNGTTHDMGFKVYCSFGTGYRLTKDPAYREVVLTAARTLSTRFNPKVGSLRSWDHHRDTWGFPVIIDNMLNLELLFAATRLSGDSSFYKIAVSHANTTLKNHFRPDFSTYHVVDYDSATGRVMRRMTHQGYADESAWARGQGWALYGYTMCYRETRSPTYLAQAEHVAQFILNHPNLPADLIPYWDFNAPDIPRAPRDASAGAVIASALYELSTYSPNGAFYRRQADKMMANLARHYTARPGSSHGFLLLHSTGNKPANGEIDVPLNYADYYFMEALLRCKNLGERTGAAPRAREAVTE